MIVVISRDNWLRVIVPNATTKRINGLRKHLYMLILKPQGDVTEK